MYKIVPKSSTNGYLFLFGILNNTYLYGYDFVVNSGDNLFTNIPDVTLREYLFSLSKSNPKTAINATSAISKKTVMNNIFKKLPEGEALYPEDVVTEETMRDVTEEIIREKILLNTSDEIPHSVAVKVTNYQEKEEIDKIYATIYCEQKSQKGILIGKGGSLLKKIGTEARLELEKIVEKKVYLQLEVKVEKDWRKKQNILKNFGYQQED